MNRKISGFFIYVFAILVCTFLSINIGTEIIAQYEMNATGIQDRRELADDLGFGVLLMLGFIPEIIVGCILGLYLENKLNAKFNKNT